jgi:hypothetical protein
VVVHINYSQSSLRILQDLGYLLSPLAVDYLEQNYLSTFATHIAIRSSKNTLMANPVSRMSEPYSIGLNRASEILTLFNLGFSLEDAYNTIRGNL